MTADRRTGYSIGVTQQSADAGRGGRRGDPLGAVALGVGVAGVLLGAALALGQPFVFRAAGTQALGWYGGVRLLATGLLGLVALVLGLVGLLIGRPRRAASGAGLALGAVLVLEVAVGLLVPLLYGLP